MENDFLSNITLYLVGKDYDRVVEKYWRLILVMKEGFYLPYIPMGSSVEIILETLEKTINFIKEK